MASRGWRLSQRGGCSAFFPFFSFFFFFTFLPCPSTSLPVGNKPFIQAPRPDCGDKSASGTPSANHRSSFPFETSHRRVKEIGSRSLRRSVLLPGISCRGIRALVYSSSRRAGKGGEEVNGSVVAPRFSPLPLPTHDLTFMTKNVSTDLPRRFPCFTTCESFPRVFNELYTHPLISPTIFLAR